MKNRDKRGVTLIEFLVVASIIGILTALLLPAVQAAREAARRLQCQNKLHQLALAMHSHHDANRSFPPGVSSITEYPRHQRLSWCARLLPYLEQESLWNIVERDYRRTLNPFYPQAHSLLAVPLPVLSCPSDGRAETAHIARGQFVVALTNYLGVCGTDYMSENGVLHLDSEVRFATVTDGSSNTVMIGERPPSPDFWFGWWYAGSGQNGSGSPDMLLGAREQNIGFDRFGQCPPGRSSFSPGNLDDFCSTLHFWSVHPSGGNFALVDGSVKFIMYESAPILATMATRDGDR